MVIATLMGGLIHRSVIASLTNPGSWQVKDLRPATRNYSKLRAPLDRRKRRDRYSSRVDCTRTHGQREHRRLGRRCFGRGWSIDGCRAAGQGGLGLFLHHFQRHQSFPGQPPTERVAFDKAEPKNVQLRKFRCKAPRQIRPVLTAGDEQREVAFKLPERRQPGGVTG